MKGELWACQCDHQLDVSPTRFNIGSEGGRTQSVSFDHHREKKRGQSSKMDNACRAMVNPSGWKPCALACAAHASLDIHSFARQTIQSVSTPQHNSATPRCRPALGPLVQLLRPGPVVCDSRHQPDSGNANEHLREKGLRNQFKQEMADKRQKYADTEYFERALTTDNQWTKNV